MSMISKKRMKRHRAAGGGMAGLAAAAAMVAGTLTEVAAQEAAAGRVTGTVTDEDFGYPLPGATVEVEGGDIAVQTDREGNFIIPALPPGAYTLVVVKDGYARGRSGRIVVSPGQVKQTGVSLLQDAEELPVVEVLAEEPAAAAVMPSIQLQADIKAIASVLGKDFLSNTGARDVAGAVTKVVGVNVVDGKFVVIRGLNDRYNTVYLNGNRVPSADPDRRAVPLDLFPASVVQDIITSKTFLPNLPGEATGGHIVIKTRNRPEKPFVNFKVGLGYNTQTTGNPEFLTNRGGGTGMFGNADDRVLPDLLKTIDYDQYAFGEEGNDRKEALGAYAMKNLDPELGSIIAEPQPDMTMEGSMGTPFEFWGREAGVFFAFDYQKRYGYIPDEIQGRVGFLQDGTEQEPYIPATVRRGLETTRAGMLVGASVKTGDHSEITATYFFNRLAEDSTNFQWGRPRGEPDSPDYSVREAIQYSQRQLQTVQIGGDFVLNDGKTLGFRPSLSWNKSSQLQPDSRVFTTRYDLQRAADGFSPQYFTQPTPSLPALRRYWGETFDDNVSVNVEFDMWLSGNKDSEDFLKFTMGGGIDDTDRRYRGDTFTYDERLNGRIYDTTVQPTAADPDSFGDNFTRLSSELILIRESLAPEIYTGSQRIGAGFGMLDWKQGDLEFVVGARVETTDFTIDATDIEEYGNVGESSNPGTNLVQPEDLEEYSQITGGENLYNTIIAEGSDDPYVAGLTRARIVRTDVLPAAAFTWSMSDHTKLRLAASKTVARPSFKEIAPVPFLDIFDNVIFIGNRRLQMSSITNYDVRYEYGNGKQTAAASLFTKMIDNPIELENGAVRRFSNVDNGQVYGMELEYQGSLGFVADELEDISVGFNYSKIFSRAERKRPIFGDASRRLQGQPDYILNFNIGYDNKDWGLYTGIFLNVTGQMLALAGVNEEYPDIYQMPVSTLDWSISKKLGKSAKLTFRAANLLDAEFERRYGVGDQKVFSSFQRGRNYSFSVGIDW